MTKARAVYQDIASRIVQSFKKIFHELVSKEILTLRALDKYSDYNVHSILQYTLIRAGIENNIISIPEYKLRLSKPIDKKQIDPRLKPGRIKTIRVDVGFLLGDRIGIGEIYTPDEIHGCLPSRELEVEWVSPYHKLLHIAENERHRIAFILIVLGTWTLPPWKDAKRHSIDWWIDCWKDLLNEIRRRVETRCIVVKDRNLQNEPEEL